jgi:hypothetical protein
MEVEPLEKKKAEVWAHNCPLTPRGLEMVEEIYMDHCHMYDLYFECKERIKMNTPCKMAYFGICSCGLVEIDGAPCHHFAAVVKSECLRSAVTNESMAGTISTQWGDVNRFKKSMVM